MLFVKWAKGRNKSKSWGKDKLPFHIFKSHCEDLFSCFSDTSRILSKVDWSWVDKLKRSVSTGWLHGKSIKVIEY